jgi:hypothetical protein
MCNFELKNKQKKEIWIRPNSLYKFLHNKYNTLTLIWTKKGNKMLIMLFSYPSIRPSHTLRKTLIIDLVNKIRASVNHKIRVAI